MTYETENARIRKTTLGFEDHGIFTFYLHLEYEDAGQAFGGYFIDAPRCPGFGIAALKAILKIVEVSEWESLPGKAIRVEHNHYEVKRIGNLIKNEWLDMKELAKEFEEKPS